jgi:predicted esterase
MTLPASSVLIFRVSVHGSIGNFMAEYESDLGSVTVSFESAFLLHVPHRVDESTILVLTLHGFGSSPSVMMRLSVPAVGEDCVVASLRAPNQHYLSGDPTGSEVGYNWGTRSHQEINIPLHHEIVRTVAAELRSRFSISARRTLLMGFSQPVGLNYRLIGTYPQEAGGVLAICGGVPKDWEEGPYQTVVAPILHMPPAASCDGSRVSYARRQSSVPVPGGADRSEMDAARVSDGRVVYYRADVRSRWMANFTRPATSWMSSFRIRLARYVSTVLGLNASLAAISFARTPSHNKENT